MPWSLHMRRFSHGANNNPKITTKKIHLHFSLMNSCLVRLGIHCVLPKVPLTMRLELWSGYSCPPLQYEPQNIPPHRNRQLVLPICPFLFGRIFECVTKQMRIIVRRQPKTLQHYSRLTVDRPSVLLLPLSPLCYHHYCLHVFLLFDFNYMCETVSVSLRCSFLLTNFNLICIDV